MREDNAVYDLHIYRHGDLIKKYKGVDYYTAREIYARYDPFTYAGVDVYRDGVRLKFGEAISKFYDRSRFVTLY